MRAFANAPSLGDPVVSRELLSNANFYYYYYFFFKFFLFDVDHFLKVFIGFVTILLLFYILFFWP